MRSLTWLTTALVASPLLLACPADDGGADPGTESGSTETQMPPTSSSSSPPTSSSTTLDPDTDTETQSTTLEPDTDTDADTDTDTDTDGSLYPCTCLYSSAGEGCALAADCDRVVLPYSDKQSIEPQQETDNLAALACFFGALDGGASIVISYDDGFGQYSDDVRVKVLADGDALSSGDYVEDLCWGTHDSEQHIDVAGELPSCAELDGSSAQAGCVLNVLGSAVSGVTCEPSTEECKY